MLRAALYARYSTDEQRPESIADQVETCRRFCAAKGWTVVDTYADAAMSGSSSSRPEFERLKRDAELKRFDIVVVEALDRLSRRLADVAAFHDVLSFRGQKLHACDKGEISPLLAGILGAVAQGFLEDLKVKTKRGLRGRILSGMSAGGLGYGYKADPAKPGTREIVQNEADQVRLIFTLYASGMPPRTIAAKLNADGIAGPGGRLWGDTTIRGQVDRGTGLLNNAAYVGRLEWNRCSYTRDPSTGHRVARPNPREEWEVMDVPELRIVDDELWDRVKRQQEAVRTQMARTEDGHALNRSHRKRYILSGLIMCGQCGATYAIRNSTYYGCSTNRSHGTCTNSQLVNRRQLEASVAEALRSQWLTVANIELLHRELEKAQAEDADGREGVLAGLRASLTQARSKVERVVSAIADLGHSQALLDKLALLEKEAARLTTQIATEEAVRSPAPPPERHQVEAALETIAANLHLIFDEVDDPTIVDLKESVRAMIEKIVVMPQEGAPARIEIHGRFAGVMAAAGLLEGYEEQVTPDARTPPSCDEGVVLSVVAGAGFEPAAFRL